MDRASGWKCVVLIAALAWIGPGALASVGSERLERPDQAHEQRTASMRRPTDLAYWVTLGTTLRLQSDGQSPPHEMRHVQVDSESYKHFRRDGVFPDGAIFAVTFYSLEESKSDSPDTASEPVLVAQKNERFLGLEVLDSGHPDGRRFYSFAPGTDSAHALPAGNSCAVCHRRAAATQGIFIQHYPLAAGAR